MSAETPIPQPSPSNPGAQSALPIQETIDAADAAFDAAQEAIMAESRRISEAEAVALPRAEGNEWRSALAAPIKWMREWLERGDCDCEYSHVCGMHERELEAIAAEKALANPWMADSRPLLAEIESLAKQRDAYKDDALALIKQIPPLRFERDNLKHQAESQAAQVSALLEAVPLLRELAERMDTDNQTYWANALREILDSKPLVEAVRAAGGAK